MDILNRVRTMFPASDDRIHYECRVCGTETAPEMDACPVCDSSEISEIEL